MPDDGRFANPAAGGACDQIHSALEKLPLLTSPGEVPFDDGLYFFYEDGETSEHGAHGRVVRVGNHPRSSGGLRKRLRQHYSGRKNGSVFRKLLGGALLRRRDPKSPCLLPAPGKGHWEHHKEKTCQECRPLEEEVSQLLRRSFRFRCVMVEDREERNELEAALIATLAACPMCGPSTSWLGRYAYSDKVRSSGLWNSNHVGGPTITGHQLARFQGLVEASLEAFNGRRYVMTATKNPEGPGPRRSTLFVTHCSAGKNLAGGDPPSLYTSPRVRGFCGICTAAGVLWAIVSAKHALFFPNEWHEWYDTRLSFRGGRLRVYERDDELSQPESEGHIQHLVEATRTRLTELRVREVVYYLEAPPRWATSYLLVIHKTLDRCTREHRSAEEVLKCIETAGRIHLVSGRAGLSASLALHQANRSQAGNDASDAAPLPAEAERAPGRPARNEGARRAKYGPLREHLTSTSAGQTQVQLTFQQIERVLGVKLPPTAGQRREWWGNESAGSHVQAAAWREAGWMVESVDFRSETVTFLRVRTATGKSGE